jgi:hypothetical protein
MTGYFKHVKPIRTTFTIEPDSKNISKKHPKLNIIHKSPKISLDRVYGKYSLIENCYFALQMSQISHA